MGLRAGPGLAIYLKELVYRVIGNVIPVHFILSAPQSRFLEKLNFVSLAIVLEAVSIFYYG